LWWLVGYLTERMSTLVLILHADPETAFPRYLPSETFASDHLSLLAEFQVAPSSLRMDELHLSRNRF